MNDRIAVDIALLPPEKITSQIISLTSHLPDTSTRLNDSDCLPHITLAMGLLNRDAVASAVTALQGLVVDLSKIRIDIEHVRSYQWQGSPLDPFSELVVEPNPGLTKLHADVMLALKGLLTYSDVRLDDFMSPPEVSEYSIPWVEKYAEHHKSPDSFHGHITLGEGTIDELPKPIQYNGSRLALCQLGTYCTCRKILAMI